MTRTIFILSLVSLFGITFQCTAQDANFEGSWKRDNDKTQMPEGMSINSIPYQLEISKDKDKITIKRLSQTASGAKTSFSDVLFFDGKPSEVKTPSNLKRISTLSVVMDGKHFTQTVVSTDSLGVIRQNAKLVFSLTEDSKLLTVEGDMSYDGLAAVHVKSVYERF